jgi:hypothetical protein
MPKIGSERPWNAREDQYQSHQVKHQNAAVLPHSIGHAFRTRVAHGYQYDRQEHHGEVLNREEAGVWRFHKTIYRECEVPIFQEIECQSNDQLKVC